MLGKACSKYREANAERCKANALAWSAKNWDKRLAASRKYRVERRERALSNEAAYRERNRQAWAGHALKIQRQASEFQGYPT
jgi:hypothetical protein